MLIYLKATLKINIRLKLKTFFFMSKVVLITIYKIYIAKQVSTI